MTQLLQNAAYGTALILAAALLRKALKGRLIPGARLALWAVCLFRLLTPAAPESVLSLWGFFRPRQAPVVSAPAPVPAVSVPNGVGIPAAPNVTVPATPTAAPAEAGIPWEMILLEVWLAVGIVLAVRYALSWLRTRRAVSHAVPLGRDDPRYASLPRCARLREGPMEGAPLTFGVARPTVVLSPGLEGEALDCVLAHEGVHASRRDNLWHYAMAVALIVHWWNPAVWLMARLLRRDIELSCDRAAVRKLGPEKRADYARALVSLATQGDGPAFCQTFGRKAAEERILSVMKFKKTSVIGVILSLALVLTVTAAFASEPTTPDAQPKPDLPANITNGVFYKDGDGKLIPVDPNTVSNAFVFNSNEDGSIAAYAPYGADFSDAVALWMDGGLLGEPISFKDTVPVDPDDVDLSKMKALLAEQVAAGELTQEQADAMLAGMENLLDLARRGEAHLYMSGCGDDLAYISLSSNPLEGGSSTKDYAVSWPIPAGIVGEGSVPAPSAAPADPTADLAAMLEAQWKAQICNQITEWLLSNADLTPCTLMSCGETVPHTHDNVCYGAALAVCTLDDCGNNTVHTHNGVSYKGWTNKFAIPPACTDEACTVSGPHGHVNGEVIHFYSSQEDEPIGEPELNYDPQVADSAGDVDLWPVCGYPTAKDFANSTHHSEMYHGDDHHENGHH